MKKLFIVAVNILVILILFISFDMFLFHKEMNAQYTSVKFFLKDYYSFYKKVFKIKSPEEMEQQYIYGIIDGKNDFYRPVVNKESKKRPIILFGCSFVYGILVPDDKIFSEVLGRYTERPIYNRANHGFGPAQMLYQLQNENFYKIVPEPEYVIYTFMHDHPRRMFGSCISHPFYYDIFYKLKNNQLYIRNYFPKTISSDSLKYKLFRYKNNSSKKYVDLFRAEILESNKLIKEHWKNTKFIIFVYTTLKAPVDILKNEFEQNGIKVIYRTDFLPFDDYDPEYSISKTDNHPNEYAWERITPKLMEAIENND